jgi:hypothetical protein
LPDPHPQLCICSRCPPQNDQNGCNYHQELAILDSGATSHFLTTNAPAVNIMPATVPIITWLPNGKRVQSTHTCTLDLPALPSGARTVHIIPSLALHSLLLVMTMCNTGCDVTFTKIGCTITYCGRTIICGCKCMRMGLWMIPFPDAIATLPHSTSEPTPVAMAAHVKATLSAAEYARYLHQCLCSPPATMLLHALEKSAELKTIPKLTAALIHAPPLDQQPRIKDTCNNNTRTLRPPTTTRPTSSQLATRSIRCLQHKKPA